MRIVYVTEAFPHGRGESFLAPEVRELLRQGHEVILIPADARQAHREELYELESNTRSEPFITRRILVAVLRTIVRRPQAVLRLLALVTRTSPRNAFHNLIAFPKACWIAQLVKGEGVDHIHAYWATRPATMALVASELSGINWSFTAHRYDIVANNLLKKKAQRAQFVRFISNSGCALAIRASGGLPEKLITLHVGVELPAALSPHLRAAEDEFVVVCPANLVPVKGHRFLIAAVGKLRKRGRKIRLRLAGDGPLRQELSEFAEQVCPGGVEFLSHVTHEKLIAMYRDGSVDAVVLPSLDLGGGMHEGIPVALIEAMSWSIPVVATRTGGIPELLEGGAGILVEQQSAAQLAEALEALAKDERLRSRLGREGRNRVEQAFDVAPIVRMLCGAFRGGHPE